MIQLPRFAGLEKNRTEAERGAFVRTISSAGYDPTGVASVIETESAHSWDPSIRGAKAFSKPPGYAIGLIQFAPQTAASLGTSTDALERMTFEQQLKYVVAYYDMFGGPSQFSDPGDYYLAGWGTSPRSADDKVLAVKGDNAYEKNTGLDLDGNGEITAGDLRALSHRNIAAATKRGVWSYDVQQTPSITIRVRNPQGENIGTTSISDADAPGLSPLASIYGAPFMIAYPNGWRLLQFAPDVQIPAKSNHPYTPIEQTKPLSMGLESGAAIGIIGIVVTIFVATLQVQPGKRKAA